MGNNNFLKIGAILLWIAMSVLSGILTVESFYLLLGWNKVILWILALAFLFLSSLGTKYIYDSLNTKNELEYTQRTPRLIGGIALLLCFWLCFSLPTNTHSLFIYQTAKETAQKDLTEVEIKLQDLRDGKLIDIEWEKKVKNIHSLIEQLDNEIKNIANPGFGPNCRMICSKIESAIDPNGNWKLPEGYWSSGLSKTEAEKRFRHIKEITLDQMKIEQREFYNRLKLDNKTKEEIKKLLSNTSKVKNDITNNRLSDEKTILFTTNITHQAYPVIAEHAKDPTFSNKVSKTEKLKSVFDTLRDWTKGEYDGRGFVFWIILSVLIDVAGFVFFTIAFKKD